jgi:hypothetical protein
MTGHITTSRIQRFRLRALPVGELTSIAEHLDGCPSCNQQFTQMLRSRLGLEPLKITLAPEFQFRHEHVDYEQLVRLADETMDGSEREMLDVHLKICAPCQEDVRSFLTFREQIDKETAPISPAIARQPTRDKRPWFALRRGLAWNPAYAAAVVLIGIALVIGVALLLKRRAGNLEAKQAQPPQGIIDPTKQTPTPENQTVNVQPTPAPAPSEQLPRRAPSPPLTVKNQEGLKPVENAGVVAVLKDERGKVTVDKAGNVSGLDEIPQNTRQEIGEVLLAENIKAPATQTELGGGPIVLRGPDNNLTFRLRSPARSVIISDRPSFEWEKLAGATSYRVSVGDLKGREIAKSEELASDQTRWSPPTSLRRGEIYVWEVEATIEGRKIVSPGRSAPQMKFKILSENSAQELEQLKRAASHLALGVFYAREGMIAEAEQEFQILVRKNPRTTTLKKLLGQIQSWRPSN